MQWRIEIKLTRKSRLPATAKLSPAWEQDEMLMNQLINPHKIDFSK